MSFSHTLLEELQLPSDIATLGERTKQTLGDTSTVKQYSFSGGSVVAKSCCALSSNVVIRKGDSNASIRVLEKLMKLGELLEVS